MDVHLKIIGILFITLAAIHVIFPKYFKWKSELAGLSLVNRQMMYVHTFFIALTVLLMGILCLTSSHELINTPFGNQVAFSLGIFWLIRLIIQFFGYSPALWKGKLFETCVHIFFLCLWVYTSFVFLSISLR